MTTTEIMESEEKLLERVLSGQADRLHVELTTADITVARNTIQRKLWLNDEIMAGFCDDGEGADTIELLAQAIMSYNADDSAEWLSPEQRKPIKLYINSIGGDIFNGMHLIDVIRCSKTPIYTIVQGQAMSMAFHVAIAGHKRFAMENAVFLIHDGEMGVCNSASKTDDFIKFSKVFQKRLADMAIERTKLTKELLKSNERKDWYLFADEALKLGIIDKIITPQTTMDEIV